MTTKSFLYHRHRFPPEVISYCVWLYNSFSLSYPRCREDDAKLEESASHMRQSVTGVESERQTFANEIRRRRPTPGRKWHLDEMRVEIKSEV